MISSVNEVIEQQKNVEEVLEVEMEVGIFSLVMIDQLEYWFEHLCKDSILEKTKFSIKETSGKIQCQNCTKITNITKDLEIDLAIPLFQCIHCKSTQTMIIAGKDIMIKKIHLIEEDLLKET